MPLQDNTPPFSRRRARACTAGVSETAANKLLVAGISRSCAKPIKHCRTLGARQPGDERRSANFAITSKLLPFDSSRRFTRDIEADAVDAFDFVDNTARESLQ